MEIDSKDRDLSQDPIYIRAKKRVKAIKSFYINLTCYCIIIPTLAVVNLILTPDFLWFLFSMLGWGIGLLFHGMDAFGYNPFLGKNWEERKIREIINKNKNL